MCDWTSGELRTPTRIPVAAARIERRKPSATVTSADVGLTLSPSSSHPSSPPPPSRLPLYDLQPLPSCSVSSLTSQIQSIHVKDLGTEQGEAMVMEWLDQMSDADEEIIEIQEFQTDIEPAIDYAGEEPAILPEETDNILGQWLADQDINANRTVTAMLPDDSLTFDWSNNPDSFLGQRENFTGDSGPTFPIFDSTRPMDIFLRFFDDDILNLIVSETNRHFASITQPLQKHSRLRRFKEADKNEVAVFIAVLIFQSVLPLPVEKDYFRENCYPLFRTLSRL